MYVCMYNITAVVFFIAQLKRANTSANSMLNSPIVSYRIVFFNSRYFFFE